ncbi:DUF2793 domain-containing protein [Xanthobacter sediminis]
MPELADLIYSVGTVSVSAGGMTVTGVGTGWSSADIQIMDTLELGGAHCFVAAVGSDTQITLLQPWPGEAVAAAGYAIVRGSPLRWEGAAAGQNVVDLIARARLIQSGVTTTAVAAAMGNAPPGAPITGDTYLVGTAPTGAWAGHAGQLATWTGTDWSFRVAGQGWRVYSRATGAEYVRSASAWVLSGVDSRQPLDATLTGLAAVSTAADQMIYATGTDAFATAATSAYGRSLLAPADAESAQILLNLSRVRSQLTTIADDTALQIDLGAGVIGWGVVAPQFSSGAAALFAFRATSGGYYVRLLASVGTIAVSSVPLTGTTGADGGVTLSVTSATFWVENRTGGSQPYLISLFRNT